MAEPVKKKVDESWKEQAEREKRVADAQRPTAGQPPTGQPPTGQPPGSEPASAPQEADAGLPEARFDLFVSGLAMEALIALGDMPHPATRRQAVNLPQAKYLIDLLGLLEEKTKSNLSVDEERLLTDTLYQLRMRYLGRGGG